MGHIGRGASPGPLCPSGHGLTHCADTCSPQKAEPTLSRGQQTQVCRAPPPTTGTDEVGPQRSIFSDPADGINLPEATAGSFLSARWPKMTMPRQNLLPGTLDFASQIFLHPIALRPRVTATALADTHMCPDDSDVSLQAVPVDPWREIPLSANVLHLLLPLHRMHSHGILHINCPLGLTVPSAPTPPISAGRWNRCFNSGGHGEVQDTEHTPLHEPPQHSAQQNDADATVVAESAGFTMTSCHMTIWGSGHSGRTYLSKR